MLNVMETKKERTEKTWWKYYTML